MDLSGLNLQPGVGVQAAIRARYGEPVNHFPVQGLNEFFHIVSVGRCKLKLLEKTIGFLLQATIDGSVVDFRPQQISDRAFRFVVASRNVGFHIYNLWSFSCEEYHIFFNLWNNGGAHWQSESEKYFKEEEEAQWNEVKGKRSSQWKSYADIAKSRRVSGANVVPIGPNKHYTQNLSRKPQRYGYSPHRHYNSVRASVFQRIEWPRNHVPLNHTHGKDHNSSRLKNKAVRSNERGSNFQIPNRINKGKGAHGSETWILGLSWMCSVWPDQNDLFSRLHLFKM
jgi:hypothetical protein